MSKNQKGFTLIEVICSVALLAIIVTASASFFKSVTISQKGSKDQMYANNIAQEVMEEIIRTGDLTKDYTSSYGKGEFTIDVTSQPNAATIGGNGRDLNGDGVVDQKDRDLAATMYPDRPTTTKIPITYEATNVPEVGNTNKPEGTVGPIEDYNGQEFNIHLDMVDYIDEDLPALIAAGNILKNDGKAPYTKDEIVSILNTDSSFSKYREKTTRFEAGYTEKASVIYRYLTKSQIANILTTFTSDYSDAISYINSYVTPNKIYESIASSWTAEEQQKAQQFYDEVMPDDVDDIIEVVSAMSRLNYDDVVKRESEPVWEYWHYVSYVEDAIYQSLEGLSVEKVKNLIEDGSPFKKVCNEKLYMEYVTGSNKGPYMISKFMDNNDDCMTYTIRNYTNKVDDYSGTSTVCNGYGEMVSDSGERPNIRFQLYGHYLNLYTFNDVNGGAFSGGQIKWKNTGGINSSIPTVEAPLGIKLINLPVEREAAQAVADGKTEGHYFYGNVLHQFSFYVTGGMSYMPVKITTDFTPYSGADKYYDLATGSLLPYSPRVNYFKKIEYGKDLYEFKLCDPQGWINLNKESNYDPNGETKNNGGGAGPGGGPGGGNGGSIDTDHGVQREKVTLWLELNVDQTDLYTVRVKNKKGKVVSELICDGNQALFKAV